MHRSGTSALTRVLSLAGAKLPNCLMGGGIGNELGHWEPARLVAYHDDLLQELNSHWSDWRKIDWSALPLSRRQQIKREIAGHLENDYGDEELIVLKEPRICRFAPYFLEALAEAGYNVRVIMPVRNPLEITESLRKRGNSYHCETMHFHSSLLWLRHVLDAEIATRDVTRAIVSYESLLYNWRGALAFLSHRLSINWPNTADEIEAQIRDFLASERRHHHYSTEDLHTHPDAFGWLTQAYETLLTLQHNPYSDNALKTLDRIRQRFNDAEPVLRGLVSENRHLYEIQTKEIEEINENRVLAFENQIEELREELHELQQKVKRRKERQRKLKGMLSNPAKYIWKRKSDIKRMVAR